MERLKRLLRRISRENIDHMLFNVNLQMIFLRKDGIDLQFSGLKISLNSDGTRSWKVVGGGG
jgi:hypothetical protein